MLEEIDCTNDDTIRRGINSVRNAIFAEDCIMELSELIEPGKNDTTCTLGYAYYSWAVLNKIHVPEEE